jgi:hypothetical protein
LTFNGLHGFPFQEIELFIATAVRTSNPIYAYSVEPYCETIVVSMGLKGDSRDLFVTITASFGWRDYENDMQLWIG